MLHHVCYLLPTEISCPCLTHPSSLLPTQRCYPLFYFLLCSCNNCYDHQRSPLNNKHKYDFLCYMVMLESRLKLLPSVSGLIWHFIWGDTHLFGFFLRDGNMSTGETRDWTNPTITRTQVMTYKFSPWPRNNTDVYVCFYASSASLPGVLNIEI